MVKKHIKILTLFLVLLCCFMGTVCATEDLSSNALQGNLEDALILNEVVDDARDTASLSEDKANQNSLGALSDEYGIEEGDEIGNENIKNILGDNAQHDVIYVNISKDDDGSYRNDNVKGQSWEDSYNSINGLSHAISRIKDNGIIYIAGSDPDSSAEWRNSYLRTVTFIGENRNDTIFNYKFRSVNLGNVVITYINMTIHLNKTDSNGTLSIVDLSGNNTFINCTFIDSPIFFTTPSSGAINSSLKFYNCHFINSSRLNDGKMSAYVLTTISSNSVEFHECLFENLTYGSVFYTNASQYEGVYIYNSTFINCNVNGIVDISGDEDIGYSKCRIEDCIYDFDAHAGIVSTEGHTHNYINATEKIVPVDIVVDISSSEKGVVVIKLTNGTDPISGANIKYSVNGGDEQTNFTDEDGKFTISGLNGEVFIAVSYEGNESFNPITGSKTFNFTDEPLTNGTNGTDEGGENNQIVLTKLAAPQLKAVYNIDKYFVITLKDADGNVLSNKKISVKLGSIIKILTTDSKGHTNFNVAALVPNTYTAVVRFEGDDDYAASSVKSIVVVSKANVKIIAKAKSFKVHAKAKNLTATLKDNKGKLMKNIKLVLKVGKKTYVSKTNKKGVANFKVKLNKKGKYIGLFKFAGNKYFKSLSKKVKITIKK